jgi:hypothetical protein
VRQTPEQHDNENWVGQRTMALYYFDTWHGDKEREEVSQPPTH